MNRLLLAPLLLAAFSAGCGEDDPGRTANASANAAVVQPVVGPRLILPKRTGRVVDQANILSAPTESEMTSRLAALEAKTSDQVVVVTVPALGNETIDAFSMRLGNGWGVGRKDLDNGVLLVVAPNERVTRISVGLGLEGLLTNGRSADIVQGLIARFKTGNYDEGVMFGVGEIIRTLESDARRPRPGPAPTVA